MTILLDSGAIREEGESTARRWARRAVLEIVREPGARVAARPVFRDEPAVGLPVADADPLSGLTAAAKIKFAVRWLTVEYARLAPEEGHSWRDIAVTPGLKGGSQP